MAAKKDVVVIGQGYVGLPLALEAARAGWKVTGVEIDPEKFEKIVFGVSPIEDISDHELNEASSRGNYKVSNSFDSLKTAEIVVICVPTPLDAQGLPDLNPLRQVIEAIVENAPDDSLIINESTSYPGTVRIEIEETIRKCRPASNMLCVAAPERVDPGNLDYNHRNTPRIIGSTSPEGAERALQFYGTFCEKVIVCKDPETVEMAKLLENTFRLVNIALINQIAEICAKAKIDVREVIAAAQTKPFGFMAFNPGLGVGGHCIPIDPMYLDWYARKIDSDSSLIEISAQVNIQRTRMIAEKIKDILPNGGNVQVVGIGYKKGTKDLRESPSIELIRILRKDGIEVSWRDPFVEKWNDELSDNTLKADLLVYVHPYLEKQEISGYKGIIFDLTGTIMGSRIL